MKTLLKAVNLLAQNDTKNTQQYRYDFEGLAIGPFRQYTIRHEVSDLDPDGFVSDASIGDEVIDDINWGDLAISPDWQLQGRYEYRYVWDPEEEDDSEAEYFNGAVIRTKVNAGSDLD